jgi:hypothetical protein
MGGIIVVVWNRCHLVGIDKSKNAVVHGTCGKEPALRPGKFELSTRVVDSAYK